MRSTLIILAAIVATIIGCDRTPSSTPSHGSVSVTASPGAAPSGRTAAPSLGARDIIAVAFEKFDGFPALHGTVVLRPEGTSISFEIWAREPEFRVDARIGDEIVPWIVNEHGSNIREPHLHAPLLIEADPRNIFMSCQRHRVIGSDVVLDRPVSGIRCFSSTQTLDYWIDDATGLVLRSSSEDSSWEFTSLELDPVFPPGLFDFETSPSPRA